LFAAAGAETNFDIVGRAGNQEHRDHGTDHRREKARGGNHRLEVAKRRRSQHYRVEHAEDREGKRWTEKDESGVCRSLVGGATSDLAIGDGADDQRAQSGEKDRGGVAVGAY
jgi:hypothetical protein